MDKFGVLKQVFGYDTFLQGQEELIDGILQGRDVLGVMPTGGGKSLCFQIPALLFSGITIVVSPLISLMQDQVNALVQLGVKAAYFNSSLSPAQLDKALLNAMQGQYKIIYVAPERLLTRGFLEFAQSTVISMLTVDEAHCISQWGHHFRPEYLSITDFLKQLPYRPVVSAFTATATKEVQEDIVQCLRLQTPIKLVTGFDRKNLYFQVKQTKDKNEDLLMFLEQHAKESGIVYCATRAKVEEVCRLLVNHGIHAKTYHAGMSEKERKENQEAFLYDRISVMVATNAFGMGIDKSNVSFVVHYNMPKDIESYYQEAGRAGRDGQSAECLLLFSPGDIGLQRFLIDKSTSSKEEAKTEDRIRMELNKLSEMAEYGRTDGCLRRFILRYFGDGSANVNCGNCSNCLHQTALRLKQEAALLKQKKAVQQARAMGLFEEEDDLLTRLKKLRKTLAAQRRIPPFIIFSDAALQEMVRKLPKTEWELLNIPGVGEFKLRHYGQSFLEEITAYQNEHGHKDHSTEKLK